MSLQDLAWRSAEMHTIYASSHAMLIRKYWSNAPCLAKALAIEFEAHWLPGRDTIYADVRRMIDARTPITHAFWSAICDDYPNGIFFPYRSHNVRFVVQTLAEGEHAHRGRVLLFVALVRVAEEFHTAFNLRLPEVPRSSD